MNLPVTSLNPPRLPNASNLKQQVPPPAAAQFTDPLKVLEEVIGKPVQKGALENGITDTGAGLERPSQLSDDVDFDGLSLQAFAEAADREAMNGGIGDPFVSVQTVEECEYVLRSGEVVGSLLSYGFR